MSEYFINAKEGQSLSNPMIDLDRTLGSTQNRDLLVSPGSTAVFLLGALLIFSPLIEGGTTHGPVLIIRLLLLCVVTSWTVYQMMAGSMVLAWSRLSYILALFLGWAGLSIWWAPYKNPSVQWVISLLMYAVLFGVVLQGVRTNRQVRQVVMVLVGMGLCEGLLGIAQYVWLGEARAKGTFFNPNFFATYEVAVLSIVLGLLSVMRWSEMKTRQGIILLIAATIMFCAFIVAQSRGVLVALIIAVTFIGCYRFGKMALVLLIVCLAAGIAIPNPLKQRMADVGAQDPYAFSRVDIWKNSIERIGDQPLGIGLGMYKYASFQYRFPIESNIARYGKRAESAHGEYLQMAVELGIGGLLIFLVGIGVWGWEAKEVLCSELEPYERGLATGLVGALWTLCSMNQH